jgi:WhiB family transcriptional regulator, redox-sensing transcriptional regulator
MFPRKKACKRTLRGQQKAKLRAGDPRAMANSEAWMTSKTESGRWWEQAACKDADPDLFFPVSGIGSGRRQAAEAKAVCASCGVRQLCLDYALVTRQEYGVWGGTTEADRHGLAALLHRELSRAS